MRWHTKVGRKETRHGQCHFRNESTWGNATAMCMSLIIAALTQPENASNRSHHSPPRVSINSLQRQKIPKRLIANRDFSSRAVFHFRSLIIYSVCHFASPDPSGAFVAKCIELFCSNNFFQTILKHRCFFIFLFFFLSFYQTRSRPIPVLFSLITYSVYHFTFFDYTFELLYFNKFPSQF